ncbi:solute carrier family 22 member 13-like isoform X2 [Parambassis ranga]|uniref:Solute carrier family 22 member 13-like isoform X2 n=1 Tax=Parambassis ranga TaxID=210632 RepID=A0A6P7K8G7_9TELE|nr:solute carrier family 22 member 13-like isoform X2 [Parambassis ranga]
MVDFGEVLRTIGEFGLFQQLTLIALCFPNFTQPFILASFIFIQSDPERHCNTDWILRADPDLSTGEQLNLTLPREEDGSFSRCRMFVPVDWNISDIREHGLNETTGCRDGWVYTNSLYEATIVTDFDLVCGQTYIVQVIQTVFMAGVLIGSLVFGPFAESFGRKRATQIPSVIMFVSIVTTALSPGVYLYIASQFLVGFGAGGFRVNCIILSTEWIGVSKRSWGACMTQLFSALGQCALAVMIYFVRNWRLAQLITAAPLAVVVVYIWFIPESARWLLSRGRTEEAKKLIIKAATINKRPVPDDLLEKVSVSNTVNKGGLKIIFRSAILTRYFLIVVLACLYLNIGNLGLNIFLTQLLFGISEIPASLLSMWLLEIFGRKPLFIATLLTGGLSAILILAVPEGLSIVVTCLVVAARFFLLWAVSVTCVLMQELTPTPVRQTATALGTISGRLGGLVAPPLNILSMFSRVIPISVYSSLTLVSGVLGLLLPETKNKELPETVEEAENNRNVSQRNSTKL